MGFWGFGVLGFWGLSLLRSAAGYSNITDFYDIQETLGSGKFGCVKRGVHKHTQKEVAIKTLKKKAMSSNDSTLCILSPFSGTAEARN